MSVPNGTAAASADFFVGIGFGKSAGPDNSPNFQTHSYIRPTFKTNFKLNFFLKVSESVSKRFMSVKCHLRSNFEFQFWSSLSCQLRNHTKFWNQLFLIKIADVKHG